MKTAGSALDPGAVRRWVREAKPLWETADPEMREWATRYGRGHVEHFESVVRIVRAAARHRPIERALDIGAVPGHLALYLAQAGIEVDAVDLDPDRMGSLFEVAGVAAHRVDVEREPLPFEDESFDLVLLCEILEHMRINPLRPFREVARVLRPGGTVVVSVPHITPLIRFRFLRGEDYQGDPVQQFGKLESIGHMGHFRYYSRREIEGILTNFGLTVAEVRTGGKLKEWDRRWDARLLRRVAPRRMRSNLYVCGSRGGGPVARLQ